MSSSFIATGGQADDQVVANDGWWPSLTVAECRTYTGLGTEWSAARVASEMTMAAIEINGRLTVWQEMQTAASLAAVPAKSQGGISEKVILYRNLVYSTVRALHLDAVRDYDTTKQGHGRADALVPTADSWRRRAALAEARLTGRSANVVELI